MLFACIPMPDAVGSIIKSTLSVLALKKQKLSVENIKLIDYLLNKGLTGCLLYRGFSPKMAKEEMHEWQKLGLKLFNNGSDLAFEYMQLLGYSQVLLHQGPTLLNNRDFIDYHV